MYACRSWTWISYSVSRRRVLESDMEAGRNFENPSRLGLLFLSNSFIAHPFYLTPCRRPFTPGLLGPGGIAGGKKEGKGWRLITGARKGGFGRFFLFAFV